MSIVVSFKLNAVKLHKTYLTKITENQNEETQYYYVTVKEIRVVYALGFKLYETKNVQKLDEIVCDEKKR